MVSDVSFVLDGARVSLDFRHKSNLTPTTTVLNFLRTLPSHRGAKEGCAAGDCGACTVVVGDLAADGSIRYRAVDSCLIFLPMIHRKQLITVENLAATDGSLHPVQIAMVESGGSQCGYCTPGIIMSLFALFKNIHNPNDGDIEDALTGNLCRCTGYKPIVAAAAQACALGEQDHFTHHEDRVAHLLCSIPESSLQITTDTHQYFRPQTMEAAIEYLCRHPDAVVINGATDVALRVTKKHDELRTVIDLSALEELRSTLQDADALTLGAGLTLNEVRDKVQELFPALARMLNVFGSQQIRNLASLGGNIGSASPIGDTIPVLMAYNAAVVLQGPAGRRDVGMSDFIKGYHRTDRRPDELIVAIRIPKTPTSVVVRSYKVSKRRDLDISTVNGAFRIQRNLKEHIVESACLVYGGMADVVKRARRVEQFIVGRRWTRETVEQAMMLVNDEFSPISDARGGAEFRHLAARNLLLRFWSDTKSNG